MRSLTGILLTLVVVVLGLWLLGVLTGVGGNLIHVLLLAAPVVAVYFILTSRRDPA